MKPIAAHQFDRTDDDFYIEPEWTSERLFATEKFSGPILDPCCGTGRIVSSALAAGYEAFGSDVINRNKDERKWPFRELDILALQSEEVYNWWRQAPTIISNPPFDEIENVANRCVALATDAVALVCPIRRLPAAWQWLETTPLAKILMLTPRPSMPSGAYIAAGGRIGGGKQDFCWLIWRKDHVGLPQVGWLHRDADAS